MVNGRLSVKDEMKKTKSIDFFNKRASSSIKLRSFGKTSETGGDSGAGAGGSSSGGGGRKGNENVRRSRSQQRTLRSVPDTIDDAPPPESIYEDIHFDDDGSGNML